MPVIVDSIPVVDTVWPDASSFSDVQALRLLNSILQKSWEVSILVFSSSIILFQLIINPWPAILNVKLSDLYKSLKIMAVLKHFIDCDSD